MLSPGARLSLDAAQLRPASAAAVALASRAAGQAASGSYPLGRGNMRLSDAEEWLLHCPRDELANSVYHSVTHSGSSSGLEGQ
jgi:hypothetical protein